MAKAAARLSRVFPKAARAEADHPYTAADEEEAIRRACEASLATAKAAPKGTAARGGWQDDDLAAALEASRREAEARAREEEELERVLALSRKLHRREELEEDSLALALAESKREPSRPPRRGAPASPTTGSSGAASSSSGGAPPAGKGQPAADPKLLEAIQHTAMATLLARSDGRRGSSWDPAPEPEEPCKKARALEADYDAYDAELKAALAASAAEAEAMRQEEMEDKMLMEALAASRRLEEEEAAEFERVGGIAEASLPTEVAPAPSDAGSSSTAASFERIEDWPPLPGPLAQVVASFVPATGSSAAGAAAVRPKGDDAPPAPPTAAPDAAGSPTPVAANRCAEFDMAAFDADEGPEDGAQEGSGADELEWHDGLDLWWAAEGCLVDAADVQQPVASPPPGPPAMPSREEEEEVAPFQEEEEEVDDAGWTLVEH